MTIEESIRQIVREVVREEIREALKDETPFNPKQDTPITISIKEAASILGFGLNKTYELAKRTDTGFPCIQHGSKMRVPYNALIAWINQQAKQGSQLL